MPQISNEPRPHNSDQHLIPHPKNGQPPDSSMATSSIASLFSFFAPSPPSPPPKSPPSQLPLSSSSGAAVSSSKDRRSPLLSSNEVHVSPSCSPDCMSVVCPSVAYANTLFFQSAYNAQVIVEDDEPEEKLLGRFRREVMRAGVIQECNRRRFFENSQDKKKREAAMRSRRRRLQLRSEAQDNQEAMKKKSDEDDDNWDLPEGDLPY